MESMTDHLDEISKRFNFKLKREQLDIIQAICKGRDVNAVLPTGFGKYICFVVPPLLADMQDPVETHHFSLVVSPLISLIKDQARQLDEWGIKCYLSCDDDFQVNDVVTSDASVVYVTPEALKQPAWRRVMRNTVFQKRLCLFAVDEAHCISDWGEEFRPEFRHLSEVRSLISSPLLALTATATERVKADICNYLQMNDDALNVAVIPDRPNITLIVQDSASERYEEELKWLLDCCQRHVGSDTMPKVLIFCRSYRMVYGVWSWLVDGLGTAVYKDGVPSVMGRRVEMFTGSSTEKDKDRLVKDFRSPSGVIRAMVTTVAFGMGVNIPDVTVVIHWGAPKSFISYWQEVGRAGRNGNPAIALLLPYKRSTIKAMCDEDFATSLKTQECVRRRTLMALLTQEMDSNQLPTAAQCDGLCSDCKCGRCVCCSTCHALCECQGKRGQLDLFN